ncbi:MAG: hypothetical protein ACRC2R_17240 [Xenococcaceae cyanobacterium]
MADQLKKLEHAIGLGRRSRRNYQTKYYYRDRLCNSTFNCQFSGRSYPNST